MKIAPHITRVGFVFGAEEEFGPNGARFYRVLQATAPTFSVEPTAIRIRSAAEIEPAIDRFAALPNGSLVAATESGAMRIHPHLSGFSPYQSARLSAIFRPRRSASSFRSRFSPAPRR